MAQQERQPTTTARVFEDIAEMVRVICTHTKEGSGKHLRALDYIDSILREKVTRDYAAVMKRIAKQHRDD